jgi:hypothetical protein
MGKRELAMVLIVGIGLGIVGALMSGGFSGPGAPRRAAPTPVDAATLVSSLLDESTTDIPVATPTPSNAEATPTAVPLEVGEAKTEDLADVLLLTDSTNPISDIFDFNFCRIATYYGLLCQELDLAGETLQDKMLRDSQGNYFKLVGIDGDRVIGATPLLNDEELAVLKAAIEEGGVTLVVYKVRGHGPGLTTLTDGAVVGVNTPWDTTREWAVTTEAPDITRELTGLTITPDSEREPGDYALVLSQDDPVTTLVTGTDNTEIVYPIFVRQQKGNGSIFINAGESTNSLDGQLLVDYYYDTSKFTQIIPLMMTMRYALGDEAWHSNHDYANLTIDDPNLIDPFRSLSYSGLLKEMETNDYHTTIAMHPGGWDLSQRPVIAYFLAHPDRYSLVQKGNNGDGYEFYKYSVSSGDEYEARPLADQEADIREGLMRMTKHRSSTNIPHDRVMVFPYGISPEPTLVLLKQYNFLATVNAQKLPLGATLPSDWDFGMYQANMHFGNFPTLTRRHPGSYNPFTPWLEPFYLDLFIDKPALFYSHPRDDGLFGEGSGTFNVVAQQINSLPVEVEWRGLGYILKHLYLEKENDDESIDVKMYTNHLIVTNESGDARTYHIAKEENLNVPITSLIVNNHDFPYRVTGGFLTLDVRIPAGSSAEVVITYEP